MTRIDLLPWFNKFEIDTAGGGDSLIGGVCTVRQREGYIRLCLKQAVFDLRLRLHEIYGFFG